METTTPKTPKQQISEQKKSKRFNFQKDVTLTLKDCLEIQLTTEMKKLMEQISLTNHLDDLVSENFSTEDDNGILPSLSVQISDIRNLLLSDLRCEILENSWINTEDWEWSYE